MFVFVNHTSPARSLKVTHHGSLLYFSQNGFLTSITFCWMMKNIRFFLGDTEFWVSLVQDRLKMPKAEGFLKKKWMHGIAWEWFTSWRANCRMCIYLLASLAALLHKVHRKRDWLTLLP